MTRRAPDCTCGSTDMAHHEQFCARREGEVEENPANFTVCCGAETRCATCPLAVPRAA